MRRRGSPSYCLGNTGTEDFDLKLGIVRVEGTAIHWTIDRNQPCYDYIEVGVFHASLQTVLRPDTNQVPVQLFLATLQQRLKYLD